MTAFNPLLTCMQATDSSSPLVVLLLLLLLQVHPRPAFHCVCSGVPVLQGFVVPLRGVEMVRGLCGWAQVPRAG
jgi:hypothetical protein